MHSLKVQKRNGRLEDFLRYKVLNGMIKSGATLEQAESIATLVETWAKGAVVDGVIKASDIRAKVLELMRSVNEKAAADFESYRKPT